MFEIQYIKFMSLSLADDESLLLFSKSFWDQKLLW